MKLSEFYTLTSEQLESLDIPTLKKLVSEQGKKLNKRISNISQNSKANKAAVRSVESSGGRFGARGKDTKRALIAEAKREQRFMDKKTSTVKGAVAVHEESAKKTYGMTSKQYATEKGQEYKEKAIAEKIAKSKTGKLTKAQSKAIKKAQARFEKKVEKEFNKDIGDAWDTFHKWKEENPAKAKAYNKENVKQIVNDYAVNLDTNKKDRLDDMKDTFTNIADQYEKEQAIEKAKDNVWTTVDDKTFKEESGFKTV